MNDHDAAQTIGSGAVWLDLSERERRELDEYERDRLLDQGRERWELPAEPGPAVTHVRDRSGRVWRRLTNGRNWQTIDDRLGCPWPEIIGGYGPLADATGEVEQ